MKFVDSHTHIWELKRFNYLWPTTGMCIYEDFLPGMLEMEMQDTPMRNAIVVQALNGSCEEADWILNYAKQYSFIKGLVAGLDLSDSKIGETVHYYKQFPEFVGVRHILDFEEVDWLCRGDVQKGLAVLEKYEVVFDLLVKPHHMLYVPLLAENFPRLKMVVNHIGKPAIKNGGTPGWKESLTELARYPNICCKLSGMITEADLECWRTEDILPYVQDVIALFGAQRCMYGSDWPVCKMAGASYATVYNLLRTCISHLPEESQAAILGETAIDFYNLKNVV